MSQYLTAFLGGRLRLLASIIGFRAAETTKVWCRWVPCFRGSRREVVDFQVPPRKHVEAAGNHMLSRWDSAVFYSLTVAAKAWHPPYMRVVLGALSFLITCSLLTFVGA